LRHSKGARLRNFKTKHTKGKESRTGKEKEKNAPGGKFGTIAFGRESSPWLRGGTFNKEQKDHSNEETIIATGGKVE